MGVIQLIWLCEIMGGGGCYWCAKIPQCWYIFMFKTYSSSSRLVITSHWFATSRLAAPASVRRVYYICRASIFSIIPYHLILVHNNVFFSYQYWTPADEMYSWFSKQDAVIRISLSLRGSRHYRLLDGKVFRDMIFFFDWISLFRHCWQLQKFI